MTRFALALALLLLGCVDTGAAEVSVPLRVAGTTHEEFAVRDAWNVQLQRAELAFGPLTLCAGASAGELCDTARAEWLGSTVVDLLDERAHQVGQVSGFGGFVRSWMFDLGITSLLTQEEPVPLAAAEQLGGYSLVLRGTARKQQWTLEFSAELALQQTDTAQLGVPLVQKNASDKFGAELSAARRALTVRFDVVPWLQNVAFDELLEPDACEQECVLQVTLTADSQAGRALRSAILAGSHPDFSWQR